MPQLHTPIGVALVGFGYWGPNLARNFGNHPECRLLAICETKPERRALAARLYPLADVTDDYGRLVSRPDIDLVLVATSISSHFQLVEQALAAGKHVFVEKSLTETSTQAEALVAQARRNGLQLFVDHTFVFTGAVQKMKELVESGELGHLYYLDSVRINLGLFQPDVNVLYDLAPHDLSIVNHLLGRMPMSVQAMGACHARLQQENIMYLHLTYEEGLVAHFHLSWLAPTKIRKFILAGSSKMVVYDDLDQAEKVKVYDKGISLVPEVQNAYSLRVDYRIGDMYAPKLVHREALATEADHVVRCLGGLEQPISSGEDGLRVLRLLEAAQESLHHDGRKIFLANS